MHEKITVGCSVATVLVGLGLYSLGAMPRAPKWHTNLT
jgi:hypothetical protein